MAPLISPLIRLGVRPHSPEQWHASSHRLPPDRMPSVGSSFRQTDSSPSRPSSLSLGPRAGVDSGSPGALVRSCLNSRRSSSAAASRRGLTSHSGTCRLLDSPCFRNGARLFQRPLGRLTVNTQTCYSPEAHIGSRSTSQTAATAALSAHSSTLLSLSSDAQFWATLSAILSKFLGYLVIFGSLFLKLPQIIRILKNQSVEGLNKFSFEWECLGYTMALAYCIIRKVPFHVYGELFFILGQSVVIVALLYHFSPESRWTKWKVACYVVLAGVLFSGSLPPQFLETMYNFQTSMFTIARIPQVWSNFRDSSTGELSVTSSALSVAGCVARLYTSIYAHTPALVISSVAGLFSHGIILLQILAYGSKPKPKSHSQ